MNARFQALLQKFRSLPPHYRYPAIVVAAVVVLVVAHSAFDRPAPTPTSDVAIASVPAACDQSHPNNPRLEDACESARAKRALEASEAPDLCHYKGQLVGCVCPPGSRCAAQAKAQAKWDKMLAEQRSGSSYVPPQTAASAKPSPATTTASAIASASTAAAPVPVPVPVQPPVGVKAGYVREVVEGEDSFGDWETLSDHAVKSPRLTLPVPPPPAGSTSARKAVFTAWLHISNPVQTITLHVRNDVQAAATIDGQSVRAEAYGSGSGQAQVVVNLRPGWHKLTVVASHPESWIRVTGTVELQLGSTNLNPVIPVPYWAPAKATTKAPAASAKSAPVPAPAASTAAPKAAQSAVKGTPVPVPVKAGTARVGQTATKEKKP